MKIISKYKDYYDYLVGIYGEDPKLVLDRRKYENPTYPPPNKSKLTFIIGGKVIEGYYIGKKAYYGDSLLQFENKKLKYWPSTHHRANEGQIHIETNDRLGIWVSIEPYDDVKKLNDRERCPILMKDWTYRDDYYRYPILNDWNLSSLISPEEMFKLISNWLSLKITESENYTDSRSDILKLESKGFDSKRSFRPNIKI